MPAGGVSGLIFIFLSKTSHTSHTSHNADKSRLSCVRGLLQTSPWVGAPRPRAPPHASLTRPEQGALASDPPIEAEILFR
jgi:hypothetical protein